MTKPLVGYDVIRQDARTRRAERTAKQVKRGVVKVNTKRGGHRFPNGVNEPLRDFVRAMPCLIDWSPAHRCHGPVVCCHLKTRGSGAVDADNVFPLCQRAHAAQEGRTAYFEAIYGLKLAAVCRKITAQFYRQLGGSSF